MRIKSHKRILISTVTAALALLVTSMVAIPTIFRQEGVSAAGAMTISLSATPTSPTIGSNVTVTASVNVPSSENPMSAVKHRFDYDKTALEFVSYDSSKTAFETCKYANTEATTFLPQFTCVTEGLRTGVIGSVTFKVLKAGSTTVTGVPINNQAADSTSSAYTVAFSPVTITAAAASTDANLRGLTVNTGTLSPAFTGGTTSYTVSVPNSTSAITLTATAPTGGTKSGDGQKSLNVGDNTFSIISTAEDGTTKKTYTIVVTRAAYSASTNANLSALSVSGYSIDPAFSPDTTAYSLTVPYAAATVTITATKADAKSTVTGAGSRALSVGDNAIVIEVTAESGAKKSYTINITRPALPEVPDTGASSDSSLKSIYIGGYTLKPAFSSAHTSYSISVGANITSQDVVATPTDSKAKVEVSGNSNWQHGVNNILITVTAEDGSKTIYTVVANRAYPAGSTAPKLSSDNTLSSLKDSTGLNLLSDFDPEKTSYEVNVPYEIEKLGLIAVTNSAKAEAGITGDSDFQVGMNTVVVKVTAEDGSERYYTVNVNRSAASGELKSLTLDGATLSPAFGPAIREYSTSVSYDTDCLEVTAVPLNPEAKVEILGNCDLKSGQNIVRVRVEYEPGKFATYFIEVDKAFPPTILGIAPWMFWTILGLIALLILIIILLLVKRNRKKKTAKATAPVAPPAQPQATPVIEFRPEFNFGSKNNEDSQNDVLTGSGSNMTEDAPIDSHDSHRIASPSGATSIPVSSDEDEDYEEEDYEDEDEVDED